jgi:alanine-glyoxylate transaminase/serine-glyoxylate transaminase/serine-pyruvate transaminase
MFFGLNEAIDMLLEEGLDQVHERHRRLAEAVRRAVAAWGLELVARHQDQRSNSVSAVFLPDGHDAEALRKTCLDRFNLVLAGGLLRMRGRAFRIGHLGDLNELMILGTLAGVEMGLRATAVPHQSGGVQAALAYLAS